MTDLEMIHAIVRAARDWAEWRVDQDLPISREEKDLLEAITRAATRAVERIP